MFPTYGNPAPRLMLVGDAPFSTEVHTRRPYSASGSDLIPLTLHRNGTTYNDCFSAYLLDKPLPWMEQESAYFTPVKKTAIERGWFPVEGGFASPELLAAAERIRTLVDNANPNCVLTTGELALWALTGRTGVATCRGSIFPSVPLPSGRIVKVVCTLSPSRLQASWDLKEVVQRDIGRAVKESATPGYVEPEWNFLLQASFDEYITQLQSLVTRLDSGPTLLACDIETIRHEVACIGIAWSARDAICIPLRTSNEYWTIDQEVALIKALQVVLEHPNARIVGQNFHYDAQYFATKYGILPRVSDDTMVAQHLLFPGVQKALYFIASLYCEWYQYWKDELKDYKKAPADDNKFFAYNCRDCCYTWESIHVLHQLLEQHKMQALYTERMEKLWWTLLRMILRGMRVDVHLRKKLSVELLHAGIARQEFLDHVIGRPFNPKSSPQMKEFFYTEMGVREQKSRITGKASLGAEILQKLHEDYPVLGPVADCIIEMRSIGTFRGNFIEAELDFDQRVRSMFGMCGTETFRLSSSENAFGRGMNLQNLPKGDRSRTSLKMPNIREMFLPDAGYEVFDIDQAGADAQVVAWEANDESLKAMFKAGVKIHAFNAKDLFGSDAGPDGKREPYYTRTKMGTHLSNYGGYPPTMAKALGITVHEAEKFQAKWFALHPGIKEWHKRVERSIQETRTVTNRFGYRKIFFGRVDKVLPEALAWVPQSTVAIVTNKAMTIIDLEFELARIWLQVHDSLVYGLPIQRPADYNDRIMQAVRIPIPYDDPLTIPWGCKSSTQTWGFCG